MADRVVIYLEGPAPGKDLLIRSVTVKDSTSRDFQVKSFVDSFFY